MADLAHIAGAPLQAARLELRVVGRQKTARGPLAKEMDQDRCYFGEDSCRGNWGMAEQVTHKLDFGCGPGVPQTVFAIGHPLAILRQ
jgi:hypothetical protein